MYKLNHIDLYFIWKPDEEDKDLHHPIVYQIDEEEDIFKKSQQNFDDISIEMTDEAAREDSVTEKYSDQDQENEDTEKYSDQH